MFKRWFQRRKYDLPMYIRNVWYNFAVHTSDKVYPTCYDEDGEYAQKCAAHCLPP